MKKILYLCPQLDNYNSLNTMRRLLTIAAISLVALFVACDNADITGKKSGFEITSDTLFNAKAEGETIAVTYTIHTAIEGESVSCKMATGADFLTITHPAEGVLLFSVAANRTNVERVAVVEVCYGADKTTIVVNQAAGTAANYDVELTLGFMNGFYYGQKYGEGSDRYIIFLSDKGMNNVGQAYPNTTYYYIDAFGPVATNGAPYSLPVGTYTYDVSNSGRPFTINTENSQILQSTDTEVQNVPITNAQMVVTANKIVLEVTVNGELHCVTYNGSLGLTDLSTENGGGGDDNGGNDDPMSGSEKEAKSTLTDDYCITFPDQPRAKWSYEGDWWKTGYSNYVIMVMNKYNGYVIGDTLQLDIVVNNTDKNGNFFGSYRCSYTPGPGVMVAGFTDSGARPVGTWYFEYGGGSAGYSNYAMIIDGEVTISDNGDGTTHIVLDAYDCHGNNITCDWSGVIEDN